MDIGTDVWVRCDASVWAPGVVLDCQDIQTTGDVKVKVADGSIVTRRYDPQETLATNEVFLRNKCRDFVNLSCLIGLEYLHEPALLHALSERFAHDRIYTSIGDILLAVNPFKDIDLYSDATIDEYKNAMFRRDRRASTSSLSSCGTSTSSNSHSASTAPAPHVFAIAGKAFSGLCRSQARGQSILVSGESGSGKTESTKFLMRFLTSVGHDVSTLDGVDGQNGDDVLEIGKRILQTNPILESFGNARTIRNDNSSRFGKFIKIQFDAHNRIVGAEIASYLLEKVRLIHQSAHERNFHIFYELLEGGDDALLEALALDRSARYELLNSYGSGGMTPPALLRRKRTAAGSHYAKRFAETTQAFEDTGIDDTERHQIFSILAALLHLGNINFATSSHIGSSGVPEEAAYVTEKSVVHLTKCAELLGVDADRLQSLILSRVITAGNEVVKLALNTEQSKDACRSLAKAIYGRLFTWLVGRLSDGINYRDCVSPEEQEGMKTIGILDIFGFESLEENGFEQLCINYANERLQDQFNEFVFVKEQQVYVSEGIDWRSISYPSNAACLSLFDDKANGLFSLLDQECIIPKGSNQALSTKYYRYHGGSDSIADVLLQPQLSQRYTLPLLVTSFGRYLHTPSAMDGEGEDGTTEDRSKCDKTFIASKMDRVNHQFVVKHFAGRVRYRIDNFLEKNQDSLPADACCVMTTSANRIVACIGAVEGFEDAQESLRGRARSRSRGSPLRAPSVSAQFRGQLDQLIEEIGHTEAHYIRCLKPNEEKKSGVFDRHRMVEQLRSVGVLEALRIARAGYSARLPHEAFVDLFSCLRYRLESQGLKPCILTPREECKALLSILVGESATAERALMAMDDNKFNDAVRQTGVQLGKTVVFCKTATYNDFLKMRWAVRDMAARLLQRTARCWYQRHRFMKMKESAIRIQACVRRYQATVFVARLKSLRDRVAAARIQRFARLAIAQQRLIDDKIQLHRLRNTFRRFQLSVTALKEEKAAAALLEQSAVASAAAAAAAAVVSETSDVVGDDDSTDQQSCASINMRSGESDEDALVKTRSSKSSRPPRSQDSHSSGSRRVTKAVRRPRHSSSDLSADEHELPQDDDGLSKKSGHLDLEKEVYRLKQLLAEQRGQVAASARRRGRRNRLSSVDVATTSRSRRNRRTYSVDVADMSEGADGEYEDDDRLLHPPRRSQSVFSLPASDHVSKLNRRIEELDAKCRLLERMVARPASRGRSTLPALCTWRWLGPATLLVCWIGHERPVS
ncbi:hypothetical protein PINS_up001986 [Pythium insidiosum]|nr:hypothetical protein PINS_up001986 [Pythium insidiosum]